MIRIKTVYVGTYHHRWVVPLLVGACSIWIDTVVDDLECCQSDCLHGAEIGLPKPACLRMKHRFRKHKHQRDADTMVHSKRNASSNWLLQALYRGT